VRDFAPLLLSGTSFPFGSEPQGRRQAVVGDAWGPAPGEMWEIQLALTGDFLAANSDVDQLSKLGFPTSHSSLVVIFLNHGLEAHAT